MIKVAVIGHPIGHSKSPSLHNYWLKYLKIDGQYIAVEAPLDGFENTVRELMDRGFRGANVTIPFKEEALMIADEASQLARKIGAANTLIFNNDKIYAENTDGYGFGQNILATHKNWNVKGDHLILGAGGASKAIIGWLIEQGANSIVVINRNVERANDIATMDKRILPTSWDELSEHLLDKTTLINTTSLGMNGENDIEIDFSIASKNMIVNDIIYTPLETRLLRDAKAAGLSTVDGLGMLLWQARPGFRAWFGKKPPEIDAPLRTMMLV